MDSQVDNIMFASLAMRAATSEIRSLRSINATLLSACEAALKAATEPCPLSEIKREAERVRKLLRASIAKARGDANAR